MDVCLNSTFHTTKAVLPYMIKNGWGRIINTGSMHALVASPFKSAYNAAKHGVAGFTKTLALETAQQVLQAPSTSCRDAPHVTDLYPELRKPAPLPPLRTCHGV